jgi:hypothetical protein
MGVLSTARRLPDGPMAMAGEVTVPSPAGIMAVDAQRFQ